MIRQSKGKIFLADERGLNEMDWYRSYNTFNFGHYQTPHKTPVETLYVCNDDTLAGGKRMRMDVETNSHILIIPTVGTVAFQDGDGDAGLVSAGQAQLLPIAAGGHFEVTNPYQDDLVNFLHIWIKCSITTIRPRLHTFDVENNRNELIDLMNPDVVTSALPYKVCMARLDSREEVVLKASKPNTTFFAFNVQGELEVQYRLLHARDGLAIWDEPEIEIEALSNDAIVLMLEVAAD